MQAGSLLRLFLLLGAIGWLISVYFTLTPWSVSESQLQRMGAEPISYQPLLDYWLKMASAAFVGIGGLYLMAFINPEKHSALVSYLGVFSLCIAGVLIVSAWCNQLEQARHPTYIADIIFSSVVGIGVLLTKHLHAQGKAGID